MDYIFREFGVAGMLSKEEMKVSLEGCLSRKRFKHSLNVMITAEKLAAKYGVDIETCSVAGLLHDCARNLKENEIFDMCDKFGISIDEVARMQPVLLHGPVGAALSKTLYGVENEEIYNAIRYHTTGRENMSIIEKIIFVSDYIEPGRDISGVDTVRKTAYDNIDKAVLLSIEHTIKHVLTKGDLIQTLTIDARNYIIRNSEKSRNR